MTVAAPAHGTAPLTTTDYVLAFTLTALAGLSTGIGGWIAVKIGEMSATTTTDTSITLPIPFFSSLSAPQQTWLVSAWDHVWAFMFSIPVSVYNRRRGFAHGTSVSDRMRSAYRILGACQAAAGGVMIAVSVLDLFPEALKDLGLGHTILWMAGGIGVFMVIIVFIPEPSLESIGNLPSSSSSSSSYVRSSSSSSSSSAKGYSYGDSSESDIDDHAASLSRSNSDAPPSSSSSSSSISALGRQGRKPDAIRDIESGAATRASRSRDSSPSRQLVDALSSLHSGHGDCHYSSPYNDAHPQQQQPQQQQSGSSNVHGGMKKGTRERVAVAADDSEDDDGHIDEHRHVLAASSSSSSSASSTPSLASTPEDDVLDRQSSSSSSSSSISKHEDHYTASTTAASAAAAAAVMTEAGRKEVYLSGLIIAIGLALHNLPEGIAVCLMSLREIKLGLPLAVAIALHNIPEGLAISLPVYHATRDSRRAIMLALYSGMAEPAGVLFVLIFMRNSLSFLLISRMLACVCGIMLYLSFRELLPLGAKYIGWSATGKFTAFGAFLMTLIIHVMPH